MTRDAYKKADLVNDTMVLVAGDGDFVPAVRQLVEDGYKVEVVFWDHASKELKAAATQFVSLNEHLEHLRLKYRTRRLNRVRAVIADRPPHTT